MSPFPRVVATVWPVWGWFSANEVPPPWRSLVAYVDHVSPCWARRPA